MTTATIARQPASHDASAQLDRAIERACAATLEPIGSGRMRDGARFWLVPSQHEQGKHYTVTLRGRRLVCSCPARITCTHAASVMMELASLAYRRRELADSIEEALRGEGEPEIATPAPHQVREVDRATAPLLRPNHGISIFKQ